MHKEIPMETELTIQSTPNPNALKFVLNMPVKAQGNYTYTGRGECEHNPIAKAIFDLSPAISEVYFFDNYITVTQKSSADWDTLKEDIQSIIPEKITDHDPNFQTPEAEASAPNISEGDPELDKINAILNETVRPALQMDGGDVQVVGYQNKNVQIFYQGACGSCPSATMGTLAAIQRILREQFDPEITVSMSDPF